MAGIPTKKFFLFILPVILYAGLIFYLSSLPGKSVEFISSIKDYILHFIEYGGLGFLSIRALYAYRKPTIRRLFFLFLFLALFAVSDEWHQSLVPGRFATVSDVMADIVGVIAGMGIYYFYIRCYKTAVGNSVR